MYSDQVGRLDVGNTRSGGKIVDTWVFRSMLPSKDAPQFEVVVSIFKTEREGVSFRANIFKKKSEGVSSNAKGPKAFDSIEDTDIERLREKVEAAVRFQHDMLTGIAWEDWLEVEVSGKTENSKFWNSKEGTLRIRYQKMKRGVDPKTGEAYVINMNHIAVPFPKPKQADVPDDLGSEPPSLRNFASGRNEDSEYSYLPATEANIAALDELMNRMDALRLQLSSFLGQESVVRSLALGTANLRLTTKPASDGTTASQSGDSDEA